MQFKEIGVDKLPINPFTAIGKEWMVITAGTKKHYNMMTASWGGLGHLWNKNVCFGFIRPQRYTKEFVENQLCFTITFFEETYRETLGMIGQKSGRDIDKMNVAGLTPIEITPGFPAFEEAKLVLECKVLYMQDLSEHGFIDKNLGISMYTEKDYHTVYVAEIIHCWIKE